MPAKNPPQGESARSSVQNSDAETTAARREYEDHRLSQRERQEAGSDEPDVLLDVPVLKVEEINLTVEGLRAHVAVLAELADLVKLSVGADVGLDKVELTIKGVEAQALLKVRLEQVRAILDKALTTIGENPEILQSLVQTVDRTVGEVGGAAREAVGEGGAVSQLTEGVGEATQRVGDAAGQAVGQVGQTANQAAGKVTDQAGQAVGEATQAAQELAPGTQLLSETTNEAGQTVQRTVDKSGDIVETTLDESGNLVDEDIVGTVGDLPSEEEHTNEEGQTVRTVREDTGALIHLKLGPDGNILDLSLPPQKEEVKEEEVLEEGSSESHYETTEEEPDATHAARQKAEQLGVDLSEVEGSGSGGRITVKDVIQAAQG